MPSAVPHRSVLRKVPSGEIAIEVGADGVWLRFDCDCMDALPFCKAACCALHGIEVTDEERKAVITRHAPRTKASKVPMVALTVIEDGVAEMTRGSDGWCQCLDRTTRLCDIYKDRPATCRDFHCTRSPPTRGWRLDFNRHASHDE